jgi:hypothetical protein
MRALFGLFITAAIAITAGVIGFQAGVASSVASAGGVVYVGGGFGGFGFLLFLLFIGVVFFAIGGMRRRAMGSGHWGGPGHWGPGSDARREWVADMHRRLHEEESSAGGPSTGQPSAT